MRHQGRSRADRDPVKTYDLHLTRPDGAADRRKVTFADDHATVIGCHALLAEHQGAEAWDGDRLVCRMARAGGTLANAR